jgi:hypothetical protein
MNILIYIIIFYISTLIVKSAEMPIVDSQMTFEEAVLGTKAPKEMLDSLELLNVSYYDFKGKLHQGQLLINKAVKEDVEEAFELILKIKFPIKQVIPIVKYNWHDDKSMDDNNTSAFNYRNVANTNRLSNHSFGRAIDFNPYTNPAVYSDGKISPKGAEYNKNKPGTLSPESELVQFFKSKNWQWGGDWNSLKDYQHFDKK